MSPWLFLLSLGGLVLGGALITFYGASAVAAAFFSVGWGVSLVVIARLVQIAGAGLAWRAVALPTSSVGLDKFVLIRLIRESINAILPVAQVGGDLIGARLLTFYGPSGAVAGASVIVDIFIQVASQFFYTVLGFAILVMVAGSSPVTAAVAIGLLIAVPVLVAFFLAQRAGGLRLIERVLARFATQQSWLNLGQISDLDEKLRLTHSRTPALLRGFAIHFATWIFGTSEVWIALAFMGHTVALPQALVIEALGQAVKGAAFAVPGAYGIQEGGFVALCAVFGIPAEAALALSLVKRVPDFAIGLPGLLAWQSLEGHRLWKLRRRHLADNSASRRG
jgi:putative membrane protein